LASEHWRLATWLAGIPGASSGSAAAPARHALRRIVDFLTAAQLEVRSMHDRPFDPGLAVRVVDAVDDPSLPAGETVIAETVSPLILWRGNVVRPADVVTRKGP
jgi:hypothetical protein